MGLFKRHITGVFDFQARENRQPFWLWVLIVYGAQMIIGFILSAVMIAGMISKVVDVAQSNPGVDPFKDNPGAVFEMMRPFIQSMMVIGSITAIITLVLLGAATVRRLHDRNMTGWWAAPVFAWHIASPIVAALAMPKMLDKMATMKFEPGMRNNPGLAMMTGDMA